VKKLSLIFLPCLLAAVLVSCAERTGPAASTSALDRDATFAETLASLDLENPAYQLSYKDNGTSLGLKIKKGERKVGKWLPKNEAADPEAQVVAYYLGRYLGMAELVIPAGYYTARARAVGEFRRMLEGAREKNQLRQRNQQALLLALSKNAESMEGIFTMPVESFELPALVDTSGFRGLGTLRQDTQIARLLRAELPQPNPDKLLDLGSRPRRNGLRPANDELTLARELSKIMVLDVLCGQFDRFSGGNLEGILDQAGRLHFIARDNGGGGMIPGSGTTRQYFEIVSRFDRAQIELVRGIEKELESDPAGLAAELRIRSDTKTFASRVKALHAHVDRLVAQYGEARVFFQD
jgi:hypothetical protein